MGYPISELPKVLPGFGALDNSELFQTVEDIQKGFRTVVIFQQTEQGRQKARPERILHLHKSVQKLIENRDAHLIECGKACCPQRKIAV